ncbi:hypothetical protein E2C01_057682 [Portunus trituberculatus]|uniref:Uncharacterized protein n=1 Tax=Portunus trituberculatus TaxID=210409 RepID=A0A5B7H0N9_PORTR|nr:hypothetical protein [Portunus trituberculatus]
MSRRTLQAPRLTQQSSECWCSTHRPHTPTAQSHSMSTQHTRATYGMTILPRHDSWLTVQHSGYTDAAHSSRAALPSSGNPYTIRMSSSCSTPHTTSTSICSSNSREASHPSVVYTLRSLAAAAAAAAAAATAATATAASSALPWVCSLPTGYLMSCLRPLSHSVRLGSPLYSQPLPCCTWLEKQRPPTLDSSVPPHSIPPHSSVMPHSNTPHSNLCHNILFHISQN